MTHFQWQNLIKGRLFLRLIINKQNANFSLKSNKALRKNRHQQIIFKCRDKVNHSRGVITRGTTVARVASNSSKARVVRATEAPVVASSRSAATMITTRAMVSRRAMGAERTTIRRTTTRATHRDTVVVPRVATTPSTTRRQVRAMPSSSPSMVVGLRPMVVVASLIKVDSLSMEEELLRTGPTCHRKLSFRLSHLRWHLHNARPRLPSPGQLLLPRSPTPSLAWLLLKVSASSPSPADHHSRRHRELRLITTRGKVVLGLVPWFQLGVVVGRAKVRRSACSRISTS